jgi:hypothetical protein
MCTLSQNVFRISSSFFALDLAVFEEEVLLQVLHINLRGSP